MPRVSVRNSVRKPTRPRAGTRNSRRAQPVPWFTICSMRPLRIASSWVTVPRNSSGTSMATRSTGSCTLPLISRVTTAGLPTVSSKPSRRIVLDQHRELQLAPALHLPRVGTLAREHAQRHVAHHLGVEAVLHQPRGHLVAVLSGERRGVDADRHREARVVDVHDRQRARVVEVGEGLADGDVGEAGDHADLTRADLGGGDAVDTFGPRTARRCARSRWCRRRGTTRSAGCARGCRGARGTSARRPRYGDASRLVTRAWSGWASSYCGAGMWSSSTPNSVLSPSARSAPPSRSAGSSASSDDATGARVAVHDREVDLVLVGVEVEEQLLHLVHHLGDAGVGAVDLVDHDHHRQPGLERLAQHEAGLGERALARVDEEEHAVDHGEAPLDLAAEVGVARGVDDVDLHAVDGAPRRSWPGS